jgi:hypothetical protein
MVRRRESGDLRNAAVCRHANPGLLPCAPFVGTTLAGDTAMAEDYRKASRKSLERATRISEIAIFLGLVTAIIVVVVGVVKGMLG